MPFPLRSPLHLPRALPLAVGSLVTLTLAAACSDGPAPIAAPAARATLDAAPAMPSGERTFGQASVEPAYDDVTGTLTYLLTPQKSPFPTKANAAATAPLYLIEYPGTSTVTAALNCAGVPGNCPDHDLEVATAATHIMPNVYGTDPTKVLGHDHLVATPGSGGDFNIAWEVNEVLFTNAAAANEHITTKAALDAAIARHDAIVVDLGFAFTCAVVPGRVYWSGTPVG